MPKARAFALAALAVTVNACTGESAQEEVAETYAEGLFVASPEVANATTVLADRLEMPTAAGDAVEATLRGRRFIVGPRGRAATNPYGFMRKVEGVTKSGSKVVVRTSPASLTDVLENADFHAERPEAADVLKPSLGPQAVFGFDRTFDFSGKELFDTNVGGARLSAKVTTGTVRVKPEIEIGAKIRWFSLKEFDFVVRGDAEAHLEVEVRADGPLEKSFGVTIPTGSSFPVGAIGPVPLTGRIDVRITCDIRADGNYRVKPGFDASIKAEGGIRYRDGDWQTVKTWEPKLETRFGLSGKGDVDARCSASPMVSLLIADFAGPAVEVGPYIHARGEVDFDRGGEPLPLDIEYGLLGRVHGRVRILHWNLIDIDTTLFDVKLGETQWPKN